MGQKKCSFYQYSNSFSIRFLDTPFLVPNRFFEVPGIFYLQPRQTTSLAASREPLGCNEAPQREILGANFGRFR